MRDSEEFLEDILGELLGELLRTPRIYKQSFGIIRNFHALPGISWISHELLDTIIDF